MNHLAERMKREHFPVDDEPYLSARRVYLALHNLTVEVHYLGCAPDEAAVEPAVFSPISGACRPDEFGPA